MPDPSVTMTAEGLHHWIGHARLLSPCSSAILDCCQLWIRKHHPYLSLLSFFEVVVVAAPCPSFTGPMVVDGGGGGVEERVWVLAREKGGGAGRSGL
ncbi:hypothetical protein E2562_032771 [Oryza meyeriana var. granulata]|uniref:Uncharacterized protein n=1 Tax=Oryza meyeriana var. granulata TaxID=110450 RepID=A0A6G1F0J9_9ORYZ|nr:hypothetical protein E2562_032771 [Oryza meyeriana var. granulata]